MKYHIATTMNGRNILKKYTNKSINKPAMITKYRVEKYGLLYLVMYLTDHGDWLCSSQWKCREKAIEHCKLLQSQYDSGETNEIIYPTN